MDLYFHLTKTGIIWDGQTSYPVAQLKHKKKGYIVSSGTVKTQKKKKVSRMILATTDKQARIIKPIISLKTLN